MGAGRYCHTNKLVGAEADNGKVPNGAQSCENVSTSVQVVNIDSVGDDCSIWSVGRPPLQVKVVGTRVVEHHTGWRIQRN